MLSTTFHSFQFTSECNSLCRFWSIKFSVIWVLGSGKILRRAFWLLGSFVTLECIQQLRQSTFSREFAPLGDALLHFFSFERTSVVHGCCFGGFFATGFAVDSVKVQGNNLGNFSKSFQACLWFCTEELKCKGFASLSVWNFSCYCGVFCM